MRSHLLGALVVSLSSMVAISIGGQAAAKVPASASPIVRWQPFVAEASRRFSVPETWIRSVMRAESGGQLTIDGRPITSRAGAMGLMQIMPETWVELRDRYGFGADAYDPHDNILAGSAYLRELYQRYGYPNLFAAYNAGPARFDAYLFDRRPLSNETQTYLAVLGQHSLEPTQMAGVPPGTSLFFALHGCGTGGLAPSASGSLFVRLSRSRVRAP